MARMIRDRRFLRLLCVFMALIAACQSGRARAGEDARGRRVMAFYYPWYGVPDGPGGAGRTVHWGTIDAANKDISQSTHYPALGAYDSHDPAVIDRHCRWAVAAHIDTFIVSWWGHGSFSDRAMSRILDGCRSHGLTACIYYETVPKPQTPRSAAEDIIKVLDKYGGHPAHLRVDGKPVVFVYGRALQELGLTGWLEAVERIKYGYGAGAFIVGDQFSYGAARVFDGVHTYNTAGSLAGKSMDEVAKWTGGTYQSWVRLADEAGKISTITVIPGYDDTKIRKPGLAVDRHDGELYRIQWQKAVEADPHWILVTSFNEWHEGSEIEPSAEFGSRYVDLTDELAALFKATPRPDHPIARAIRPIEKAQLRERLRTIPIAVLPEPESMAFWWLLDIGIEPKVLTWEQVAGGDLTPNRYPVLLYCSGEHYRRTVRRTGDVDAALAAYLRAGGGLAALPSRPWPFYYDENGNAVNQSHLFGLTLRHGWEQPPEGVGLWFIQPVQRLPHLDMRFAFPQSGDLRWRPFFAGDGARHTSLLQLRTDSGEYLGDGVAYSELQDGGHVLYVCFNLLECPYAEALLYDVFDFIAGRWRL